MTEQFSDRPSIEDRRMEVLAFIADGPFRSEHPISGPLMELSALELQSRGRSYHVREDNFSNAIEAIRTEKRPGDWSLPGVLRARFRYENSLSDALIDQIDTALPQFDYWGCCTENQQILIDSSEYLVGHLLPDREFADGLDGNDHRNRGRECVKRWLNWRARFGFCEWLSSVYVDPSLFSLINLAEFAPDPSIKSRSRSMLDLLFFEFAVHSYEGVFGSTEGRADAHLTLNPLNEPTRPIAYLLWGEGSLEATAGRGTAAIVASDYRPPTAVVNAAGASDRITIRERHSLNVDEAAQHGLDPSDPEDIMFFWGAHVWNHRDVIETTLAVAPEDHYLREFATPAWEAYQREEAAGGSPDPDPNKSAMTRANLYTRKTPEWMLSCAQDYRKGRYGFQQHIWQATLSDRAVVYTTHPRDVKLKDRPDYWRGNAVLPRAAATENVQICLYQSDPAEVSTIPEGAVDLRPETFCEFTHAFFPKYAFDEIRERDDWVFGRVADAYLGLYCSEPTRWEPLAEPVIEELRSPNHEESWDPGACDLIADGYSAAWICELGSAETMESFDSFCNSLHATTVQGSPTDLSYESPQQGWIEFGWEGPLTVDGVEMTLDNYPRTDSPYCQVPFGSTDYPITVGDEAITLTFD